MTAHKTKGAGRWKVGQYGHIHQVGPGRGRIKFLHETAGHFCGNKIYQSTILQFLEMVAHFCGMVTKKMTELGERRRLSHEKLQNGQSPGIAEEFKMVRRP